MSETLATERLIIRRFTPDDAQALHAYLGDEQVVKYEPYDTFSPEDCVREAKSRAQSEDYWAVCLKPGEQTLIGNVYLCKMAFDGWEIGYVFNRSYQGHGYATEAARALMDYAFRHGAHRVSALVNPENSPSWRLLERLGMRREGHMRENVFFSTDAQDRPLWQDTYEYAILRKEWEA